MSASNTLETAILQHIFENEDIPNVGDATGLRGSSTAGNLYISLHTSDPGEGGAQNTNEATYTGYARSAVARSGGEWSTSGNTVSNVNEIEFPEASAGTNTITHFGIGTASSGAGVLLFSGALGASLAVSAGITPKFAAGDLDITAD